MHQPFDKDANIKCYISSPGNSEGGVDTSLGGKTILRFLNPDNGKSVEETVANLIYMAFGVELKQYCHMSHEPSIIQSVVKAVAGMIIDIRAIFGGAPIYDSAKHLTKLGLQNLLRGLCINRNDAPGPFMRCFTWRSHNKNVLSQGMGVNMWALLTLASIAGTDWIHCKTRDRAANVLSVMVLNMAPAGATPGNLMPHRSFHGKSIEPLWIQLSSKDRCHHYLRPMHDQNFALTGNYSICAPEKGCMPEDYLHCSSVLSLSWFLQCEYHEIPPAHMGCQYSLMPDCHYHIYRHSDGSEGNIFATETGVHFQDTDFLVETLDVDEWEDELKERGFLVMPMVFRSGALVLLQDGLNFGCPVPDGTRKSMEEGGSTESCTFYNYDPYRFCYHLLVDENALMAVPVMYLIKNLVVPGQQLWIKPGSQAWENLREFFPDTDLAEEQAEQRAISARLNVPLIVNPVPGIIYLTVLEKPRGTLYAGDVTHRHVTASPWELTLLPPAEPALRIMELWN